MAVKLRLRRLGRKKRPFYRIVAADSRSPRDGRFIEEIGYYNPLTEPTTIEVKQERALYWLSQGAIPSSTVKSLFRKKGINLRHDLMKRGVPEDQAEEEFQKWEALQEERRKRLEAQKIAEKAAKAKPEKERVKKAEKTAEKAEKVAPVAAEVVADSIETTESAEVIETTETAEKTEAADAVETAESTETAEVTESAETTEATESTETEEASDAKNETEQSEA